MYSEEVEKQLGQVETIYKGKKHVESICIRIQFKEIVTFVGSTCSPGRASSYGTTFIHLNYRSVAEIPKIEMLSISGILVLKIDYAILKIDCPAKVYNFRNLFQKMGV